MEKKNKGKLNELSKRIFIKITKEKAKQRINEEFRMYINKKEKELYRKLTKEERKDFRKDYMKSRGKVIINEEAEKARKKAKVLAFVGIMGLNSTLAYRQGANDNKILGITEGIESIEVDMSKIGKNVEIENVNNQQKEDKHKVFIKELQDSAINENIEYMESLKEQVTKEIDELDTKDKVLEYVKQFYVDRYNCLHDNQIGIENVKLFKIYNNNVFYKDYAQNGDVILRKCLSSETRDLGVSSTGVNQAEIKAVINVDDNFTTESVGYSYDKEKFVTLYYSDEEVIANKETALCDVGNIVFEGLSRAISMDNDETSLEVKELYKEKFIQAVVDYKASRNEKVTENIQNGENNKTQENLR